MSHTSREPLLDVLRLIDDGAAQPTLEAALVTAELPADARAILRRLSRLRRERDRHAELVSVLYETATDLAAINDVEATLLAIVQRTRAVTGADMAYLSLNDHEAGETYIRKWDGVRTDGYRNIRMPLGTGVLGKAATGMAVVSTSDYVEDPSLVHLSDIDRRVRAEGVRSILGVPMNVHGRVQGALLIADRRVVDYSPETIEVVDAIARQAAVALDYSARLARVTATLADADASKKAAEERWEALRALAEHEIDDFLTGRTASRGTLAARLGRFGLRPDRPLALAVVEGTHLERTVREALSTIPALVAEHHGHVCILHHAEDPVGPLLQRELSGAGVQARIGTASATGGPDRAGAAHRSAELAVASLRLLGGMLLDGAELGSLGVLLEAEEAGRAPRPVTEPALPLVQADERRGTDLARTAWALMEFGPGVPEVARRLFLHPNTVRQRQRRITEILGEGWQSGPGRFDLHLALRAVMLRRELVRPQA